MVVLHYTAMATAQAALDRLCAPEAEVSAHYLIGGCGRVWRLVDEAARAWHAGQGAWGGIADVNSHSIGIELANPGDRPFAAAQMLALEALLPGILHRWSIPPARVIAHSDMAPERKADPGPRFDWRRLARQGLSVWAGGGGGDPPGADTGADAFAAAAHRFGYRAAGAPLLTAFRLRFRPHALGLPLSTADVAMMTALARHHPCLDPEPADT